ncbi:MAG: dTDP-4-dehydrorhamnose 3,5-epimerase [Flavobacterium sp. BFFFF1]|uniref:dTDP-4-dehydrorhamnose 3,5-epimerase n=1 Tax=unclassified Flavobacterium TaxID=196869 RepID=UPI000BD73FE3|nr:MULTISPECIES: dTDP-4-dehydrorhamnose 3,5-epimerase [unclassified Flavobacterium]OYU81336.1 MAG: dTDP-4-dehydrorhamnose 3,5-epimerase [Flavobacterium sp. BFFFF1]
MNFIDTPLEGCFILEPKIHYDDRGYLMESYNERLFSQKTGLDFHFVQDNQSFSTKGVLRGLHYQTGAHAQAKLVRVIQGEVLDVAVDIRPGSKTYGKHVSVVLSSENQRQFFVPRGFAHGFLVLSDTVVFFYKCDNFYDKASEGGIIYNDPEINIDWNFDASEMIISDKDRKLPKLSEARQAW